MNESPKPVTRTTVITRKILDNDDTGDGASLILPDGRGLWPPLRHHEGLAS